MQTVGAKVDNFDATPQVKVVVPRLAVDPPKGAIVVGGGATITLYDASVEKYLLEYAFIQNVGTNKVKYALNSDAATGVYHGILAPGIANEDGFGSTVEFNHFDIKKLTVFAEAAAGSQVSVVIARNTYKTNPTPQP